MGKLRHVASSLFGGREIIRRRHVHVYSKGNSSVKWDLDNKKAMKGGATKRIIKLIEKLDSEGML
jgi:hypothetical protein